MFRMVGLSYPSWKGIFVVVKVILKTLTDLPAFYCTAIAMEHTCTSHWRTNSVQIE